jgi:hypothetical protein
MAGYTSIKDMFDGGGAGKSGSTFSGGAISKVANSLGIKPMGSSSSSGGSSGSSGGSSVRPKARPDVLVSGSGSDKRYIDTRTGQSYAEPKYSAFSAKGLTSSDPANVARNRAAAQMYADIAAKRGESSSGNPLLDILRSRSSGKSSGNSSTPPVDLATIGAPSAAPGPVEVPTPNYGLASLMPPVDGQPALSYGSAFMPQAPGTPEQGLFSPGYMNYFDIFGPPPDLSFMYR